MAVLPYRVHQRQSWYRRTFSLCSFNISEFWGFGSAPSLGQALRYEFSRCALLWGPLTLEQMELIFKMRQEFRCVSDTVLVVYLFS